MRFGNQALAEPSRFLRDIPRTLIQGHTQRAPARKKPAVSGRRHTTPRVLVGSFAPGDRVRHPRFGEGIVVNSKGRGGDEEVIVAFAGKAGIKRLMASFAGLERLDRPE
jgi:DNA helicase-2/ATP-dependent DNA helicase PcrA